MTTIKAKALAEDNSSAGTAARIASPARDLAADRAEADRVLDLALEDTFPASDPVSSNSYD